MIDLDALVLGPCMVTFARPATFYPDASQPGAPAFAVRGIWTMKPADMALQDDTLLAADSWIFGVRGGEFPAAPSAGDRIFIPAHMNLPELGMCDIEDEGADGQGGYSLVLKKTE